MPNIFLQECDGCGMQFELEYLKNGSYNYVNSSVDCGCESSFSPIEGAPSISEWLVNNGQETMNTMPDKDPIYNIPYIHLNTSSQEYAELKKYFIEGMSLAVAHRPLGSYSFAPISYNENLGNGRYYAIGPIEKYGEDWLRLKAHIIKPITNEEIILVLKEKLKTDGIHWEDALREVEGDIEQIAEVYEAPYV